MGLPGETIEVRGGHVLIDGQSDRRAVGDILGWTGLWAGRDTSGICIYIGDNRRVSHDSRAIGPVPLSTIEGRVWLVYRPLEEIKLAP